MYDLFFMESKLIKIFRIFIYVSRTLLDVCTENVGIPVVAEEEVGESGDYAADGGRIYAGTSANVGMTHHRPIISAGMANPSRLGLCDLPSASFI